MSPKKLALDIPKVCQEYREGRSLRDLAREHGCSHVHLWRELLAAGEPIRKATDAQAQKLPKAKLSLHTVHAAHAVVLYTHGVPVGEIAYSLRHTPAWVRSKLVEAGVQVGV